MDMINKPLNDSMKAFVSIADETIGEENVKLGAHDRYNHDLKAAPQT